MDNTNNIKEEYPFVIGTAGHIDHGKTTLVRALSGVDCDRLSEEKKRGMTIELGFAPFVLPSGKVISIVDVPGHEKFIRQMVAGAAGIDAVMLTVAADDGVMPQTIEHLEILSLLGVKNGITVINKADLVDEEMLELAKEDVKSVLKGTFLEDAPIICASAVKGTGLEELRSAMQKMVEETRPKARIGKFFLPVDRIFKISGFGTVVTGTALTGTVSEGESIELLPANKTARVRSLQVHNNNVEKAFAGQRVAINISGLSVEEIERGDVFASEDFFESTDCIDVRIKLLDSVKTPVAHWQRVRLHVGTSDVIAHVSLFDREKIMPGETVFAQLILDKKIAVSSESNFIIRNYSPLKTIAGGTVLFANSDRPRNKNSKKRHIEFLEKLPSRNDMREYILSVINYKHHLTSEELSRLIQADLTDLRGVISSLEMKKDIVAVKTSDVNFFSNDEINRLKTLTDKYLETFHKEYPERIGAAFEEIASAVSFKDLKLFRELLSLFEKNGWYVSQNGKIRLSGFEAFDLEDFIKEVDSAVEFINSKGYSIPTIEELSEEKGLDKAGSKKLVSYLVEQGKVNIVAKCMLFSAECQDNLYKLLCSIKGDIILSDVRDITGSSRKYILPMLEFFDSKGITRRVDDKRILMKKK